MKSQWEFFFESTGVRFERVHKFNAQIMKEHAVAFGLPAQEFNAEIRIEPDESSYNPAAEQTGKVKIVLPGNKEQTRNLALWFSRRVGQQISFSQGEMKILYGLILGEHLPDTAEEATQLGDTPFFAEAHLVEALPTPAFDGAALGKVSAHPLIEQFNAANKADNPIDRFLGLFRILEDLYGPTSKTVTLAAALKASNELFLIAKKHIEMTANNKPSELNQNDFNEIVSKLVKTRHQCAHLRSSKGFGITHGDPRARAEVEPLANLLRLLTSDAIQERLRASS